MIRTTRRTMLAAAAGMPLLGRGTTARAATAEAPPLLLFDATTAEGRRFADQARALGMEALAIEGDRVRFASPLLARWPRIIAGVTRHADRLVIAGMAEEQGYRARLAVRHLGARCETTACHGWAREGAFMHQAEAAWPEALATLIAGDARRAGPVMPPSEPGQAAGWVLTPRC